MVFGPGSNARPHLQAAAGLLVEVLAAALFLNLMVGPQALLEHPRTLLCSGSALVLYRLSGLFLGAFSGPRTRFTPWILPPLSLAAVASLASLTELHQLPPIIAAVWGAALLNAVVHTPNARLTSASKRGLPEHLAWVCASTTAAALLLITGAAIGGDEGPVPTLLDIALGLIGVPITVGLAALTGGLVGLVLSRDVLGLSRALDRNLDQPNYPLKVTRGDRLGAVQAALEDQRRILLDMLAQHAEVTAQLREANSAKVELVSALNHNLRTSLTTILGHLQLLHTADDPWTEHHQRELVILESLAEGLLYRLRTFVDIAMLASDELRLNLAKTDIEGLIDRALRDHSEPALAAGLKLVRGRQTGPLPMICADSRRLSQAMHILLDHAIQLSEAGTISISTHIQNQIGVLEISINFTRREYRADTEKSLPKTHLALGFEIAQAIANGHGGELLRDPAETGKSTLTLALPLSAELCQSVDFSPPTPSAQERRLTANPERAA